MGQYSWSMACCVSRSMACLTLYGGGQRHLAFAPTAALGDRPVQQPSWALTGPRLFIPSQGHRSSHTKVRPGQSHRKDPRGARTCRSSACLVPLRRIRASAYTMQMSGLAFYMVQGDPHNRPMGLKGRRGVGMGGVVVRSTIVMTIVDRQPLHRRTWGGMGGG